MRYWIILLHWSIILTQQFLILKIIFRIYHLFEAFCKRKNKELLNQKYISISVFTWSCVDAAQMKANRPCFAEFINTTDVNSINRANIEHVH